MGSTFAPSFANLFMALFEEKFVYSNHVFSTNILIWKRYLDDCFCLFKGDVTQLYSFFQYLNACSDFLTFTMDFDSNKVSFLDLWIIKEGNYLHTDLFRKPTARNTFLRADSYHSLPLKNSLPYSQMCQIKRICSKPDDLNRNFNVF